MQFRFDLLKILFMFCKPFLGETPTAPPSSASGTNQIFDATTWKLPPGMPRSEERSTTRHHSLMCHIAEDGAVVVSVRGNRWTEKHEKIFN